MRRIFRGETTEEVEYGSTFFRTGRKRKFTYHVTYAHAH